MRSARRSGRAADIEAAARLGRAFADLKAGRADLWPLVAEIAGAFWGPLLDRHGTPPESLDVAEARLRISIPEALRTGYELIGDHPNLSSQDELLHPSQLTVVGDGLIRFRVENQACAHWACGTSEADPQIHFGIPGADRVEDAGSTSQFFLYMLLSEVLLTARYAANGPTDSQRITQLETFAEVLPVASFAFWPDPHGSGRRLFCAEATLLAEDAGGWLWIASLNRQAIAAAIE